MKPSVENANSVAVFGSAALICLLGGASAALAQVGSTTDAELAANTAAESVDAAAAASDAAGEEEELAPIVLEERPLFEEEPYFDQADEEEIVDAGPQPESDEQRLRRLFVLYLDAVSDNMFAEADSIAKQIVELTIRIHGLDSHESAKALTNLAIAQHGIDDYESAILNYNAAIDIIERVEDRLHSALINPLRGLGAAQLSSGRPDLARATFDRAVHISHVNEGPHNLEQVETLQSLAETYIAVGEFDEAIDVQKRIYYLQARNVDSKSVDIIPALKTRANWQRRMQLYEQERYTWRRIISVIEKNEGKNSLGLIGPLTELGNSYLFVNYTDVPYAQPASITSGEIYLKRAVRVAEANPEADWNILIDSMLELGDYYVLTERANRGHRVYREVWKRLSEDEARLKARFDKLETVIVLQNVAPPKMYGGDPAVPVSGDLPGFETGSAVFQYSVTTRGRATSIRLLEADPPGLDDMYQAVGRELRRMLHRPRFAAGEPVRTDSVTYTHTFYYRQADLPSAPGSAEQSDDDASTD